MSWPRGGGQWTRVTTIDGGGGGHGIRDGSVGVRGEGGGVGGQRTGPRKRQGEVGRAPLGTDGRVTSSFRRFVWFPGSSVAFLTPKKGGKAHQHLNLFLFDSESTTSKHTRKYLHTTDENLVHNIKIREKKTVVSKKSKKAFTSILLVTLSLQMFVFANIKREIR